MTYVMFPHAAAVTLLVARETIEIHFISVVVMLNCR